MKYRLFLILLVTLGIYPRPGVRAQTKLLDQPVATQEHLVFTYANDLWVSQLDGGFPRRLTVAQGIEDNPVISPDGQMVAFNGHYDGNGDVFVVPITGGTPKRLTWHPDAETVLDFTSDGRKVLFNSRRDAPVRSHRYPYTVDIETGQIESLGRYTCWNAAISPDGKHIAYNPLPRAFEQWKHYRGGRFSRILIQDLATHESREVPTADGSNSVDASWIGGTLYFRSDRDDEFNVYRFDEAAGTIKKLTDYTDFPAENLSAANGKLYFTQAGQIRTLDPTSGEVSSIDVTINTDLLRARPTYATGPEHIRSLNLSPSGQRLVVDYRGDILTAPVKEGDPRNLTNSPGTHETYPAWSPDGKTIAYFSDADGEHKLHLYDRASKEATAIDPDGSGFYAHPHWSPSGKHLAFVDNGRTLHLLDVATRKVTPLATDDNFFPGVYRDLFGSWSPDGRYLAYTTIGTTNFERAYLYDTQTGTRHPVSDGLSDVTEPTFDPTGQYLYLSASTDAGPVVNWFQQSSLDADRTSGIYLVTLRTDVPNPLRRKQSEEALVDGEDEAQEAANQDSLVTIDFDGLTQRMISIGVAPTVLGNLGAVEGGLYFMDYEEGQLMHYDLDANEADAVTEADGYALTPDGNKMLYVTGGSYFVAAAGEQAEQPVDLSALSVRREPRAEWRNVFREAWRVNRDFFYDPDMHGADWDAMYAKYEPFLEHLTSQEDLYRVMRWMMSELAVGHHRFSEPHSREDDTEDVAGGLLGADYTVENGRHRISKIYGGLNWNPDLRSPLTEPGVDVSEGDYLLAVNGREVSGADNLYRFFENTAGKTTTLSVSANADGSDARIVEVVPLHNEYRLRNRAWVEGNLDKVTEATDGRVAYVYVPNTTTAGHTYFKRYFYPQVDREAIIVDERFNGGGQIADYYVELLSRPYQNSWTYRYGQDQHAPLAAIHGPKVLLVNESAGSGGDLFPYLWRQYELGPIIGRRTWGGLVGVLGFPDFIDGGWVTAPNVAFWDKDGYRVENEGVAPDIDVAQDPAMLIEGRDPQLERAIEEVMRMLAEQPATTPQRPPFETRVKKR